MVVGVRTDPDTYSRGSPTANKTGGSAVWLWPVA